MKKKMRLGTSGLRWLCVAGSALFGFAVGLAFSRSSPDVGSQPPVASTPADHTGPVTETASFEGGSNFPHRDDKSPVAAEATTDSLQSALATEDLLERRQALELLGQRWAQTNVDDAIAALDGILQPTDRQALIRGIFHFLSAQNPEAALQKVAKLTETGDRLAARKELLAAWAPIRSGESVQNEWLIHRYGSGGLGMQLVLTHPPNMDLAILWSRGLDADEGKAQMLSELAALMARTSPADAIKLGDELQGEDYLHFLGKFSDGWAQRDGKAALNWSMQIADPTLRENIQQSINSTWVIYDLAGAKAHLLTLPPGPARESLLSAIATRLGSTDTAAAFAWLSELAAPADQSLAQRFIQSVAPVGIGTQLSMKDGLPVITSLVPGAAAELSQQVQPGDRIVGVDAYGDGSVSANGMDLEKVADLIRGRPGTSVRLQISKANGHGFDPPRVVVLPRSQVFNSPGK
jgi:hypothetical protein